MAEPGAFSPESERPDGGGLYRKLVLLTGIRLAVGTALLVATAWLTLRHEPFPRSIEAWLYAIVGSMYVASLIATFLLRAGKHLGKVALGQIAADEVNRFGGDQRGGGLGTRRKGGRGFLTK